jgi:hypothetical protein
MKATARSLPISSPTALRFSSSNWRSRCFTDLDLGLTRKECSTTSLGMPFISELPSKNVFFACRKSTSALSYFDERLDPMRTAHLLTRSRSRGIYFTSFDGFKVVPTLFASGACSSVVRSIFESSCFEVAPTAKSQYSTSHSYAWRTVVPTVMVPLGLSILILR